MCAADLSPASKKEFNPETLIARLSRHRIMYNWVGDSCGGLSGFDASRESTLQELTCLPLIKVVCLTVYRN